MFHHKHCKHRESPGQFKSFGLTNKYSPDLAGARREVRRQRVPGWPWLPEGEEWPFQQRARAMHRVIIKVPGQVGSTIAVERALQTDGR
jgi:hypothetical protein